MRIIDQTERRVLHGESVPTEDNQDVRIHKGIEPVYLRHPFGEPQWGIVLPLPLLRLIVRLDELQGSSTLDMSLLPHYGVNSQ